MGGCRRRNVLSSERDDLYGRVCVRRDGGWPHAKKGAACLQRTGSTVAVPKMTEASSRLLDGTYVRATFDLIGPQDWMVSRGPAKVWVDSGVAKARAEAMAAVYDDWQNNKLKTPEDV